MKIEMQLLDNHHAKLTVEFEPDLVEGAKHHSARKIANQVKIPGFRPGKAPYAVIVRQFGEASILEKAVELLIDEQYSKILDETKIQPYGPGKLEAISSMDPLILEFVVPLRAEIALPDYRSIQKPYELPQVTEDQIEDVLDELRAKQAIIEPVERPAQVGDVVTVRLSANRKQVDEGQASALIRERSIPITLHAQDEIEESGDEEWPFPGFSDYLSGLSAGDEKVISYSYPADADYELLRGVDAEFHIIVENVKARTLPEVNDEFAVSLGEYETAEALRLDIRSGLQQQAEQSYNEKYDEEILEQIVGSSTIKYPPEMLERETEDILENLKSRLERQNMDLDLYLKIRDLDMDGLRAEVTPVAEKRLKNSLALLELAKAEKLSVKPDELQAEATHTMNMLANSLPKQEARKLSDQGFYRSLVGNIMADMLSQRAMERLRAIASGKADLETKAEAGTEASGPADVEPTEMVEDLDSEPGVEVSESEASNSEANPQE